MNPYMDIQAKNMIQIIENFKTGLEFATRKDDGKIDRAEQKRIDRINKAANNLINELKK